MPYLETLILGPPTTDSLQCAIYNFGIPWVTDRMLDLLADTAEISTSLDDHSFLTFDPSITQVALHSYGNVFPSYLVKEESKNLVPLSLTNGHFILLRWSCTLRIRIRI